MVDLLLLLGVFGFCLSWHSCFGSFVVMPGLCCFLCVTSPILCLMMFLQVKRLMRALSSGIVHC